LVSIRIQLFTSKRIWIRAVRPSNWKIKNDF
jgi:hypothetical protein